MQKIKTVLAPLKFSLQQLLSYFSVQNPGLQPTLTGSLRNVARLKFWKCWLWW